MHNLKTIDHIGYAVRDIEKTAAYYVAAGWTLSEIFNEEVQHTKIAFLTKPGMTTIELVSPLEGPSPVDNILQNNGEAAGQTVFHVHMHLIPRYKGDTVQITWKPGEESDILSDALLSEIKKEL